MNVKYCVNLSDIVHCAVYAWDARYVRQKPLWLIFYDHHSFYMTTAETITFIETIRTPPCTTLSSSSTITVGVVCDVGVACLRRLDIFISFVDR